jgi:hypothetical protein
VALAPARSAAEGALAVVAGTWTISGRGGHCRRRNYSGCADLQTTYPAALTLAGRDLGAPTALRLLQRWPTQAELVAATREELVAFALAKQTWLARAVRRPGQSRAGHPLAAHP